ncbi:MAG: acyltransferase family protein [Propionibacteriaceae bacterium]|jgi:hypothetical protein|nr:acyltransferase family protein [Propionibacteriaceae bacterium]
MTEGTPGQRLVYLDNLRLFLVGAVIVFHMTIVFSAAAPYWYFITRGMGLAEWLTGLAFVFFLQSFFMGTFFALAGFFTPGSLDRKGTGVFVRARVIRLGVPFLVFALVIGPLLRLAGIRLQGLESSGGWQMYFRSTGDSAFLDGPLIGAGPLWFCAFLLVFTLAYVAWRVWLSPRRAGSAQLPSAPEAETARAGGATAVQSASTSLDQGELGRAPATLLPVGPALLRIFVFMIALGLVSWAFRFLVPYWSFIPYIDAPSPFFLPQYVAFFVVGIIAWRRGWLDRLPTRVGGIAFTIAIIASLIMVPAALFDRDVFLAGTWLTTDVLDVMPMFDPTSFKAFILAMWEGIYAVGITLGFVVLFRAHFKGQIRIAKAWSESAYAAFVIHPIVVTFVGWAVSLLSINLFAEFYIAAIIAVPLCFTLGWALRLIPAVRRVL